MYTYLDMALWVTQCLIAEMHDLNSSVQIAHVKHFECIYIHGFRIFTSTGIIQHFY